MQDISRQPPLELAVLRKRGAFEFGLSVVPAIPKGPLFFFQSNLKFFFQSPNALS